MSSQTVSNLNINIRTPHLPPNLVTRPRSSRHDKELIPAAVASSSRVSSSRRRATSASYLNVTSARPYIHEPCSSTLGKFHDSVNHSLIHEQQQNSGRSSSRNTPRSNHPVLEAKQKFKYMTKQKSYVDEALFGTTTPNSAQNEYAKFYNMYHGNQQQQQTSVDIYQYTRNHLTHNLMSNVAPLLIHPSPVRRPDSAMSSSRVNSARPDSARKENSDPIKDGKTTQRSSQLPPRPWKP
jgi:hypothetical protein